MNDCFIRTTCRLCDGPLAHGLSLTPTPPANELLTKEEIGHPPDLFPLDVMVCETCAHVQLSAVVSPKRLFSENYPYRSGASAQFVCHLEVYTTNVLERFHPRRLIEIGSNDGTMLEMFLRCGVTAIGFEPAKNVSDFANAKGIPTINAFFDSKLVGGDADVVVANHVFAHADDLKGIALGVKQLLGAHGVFVFEVGYLLDVVDKGQFDVIYFEHTSYHHLHPLIRFFDSLGMFLFDAERVDTQGGAIRCYVRKSPAQGSDRERAILSLEEKNRFVRSSDVVAHLQRMGQHIAERCTALKATLHSLKSSGKRIAAYGAPAKAVTFLHQADIGSELIDFVVDDNPLKQGLYLPGKNIPILPTSALYEREPSHVVILAWNFASNIKANHPELANRWVDV